VDILLLNLMVGGFEAGIFAAASRITLLFALLVSSLGAVTSPRFSAFKHHHEIIAYLKKVSLLVVGVSIFMLFTMLIADPLVRIVFGEKFIASVPIFQALTVAMIPFLFTVVTVPPLLYSFNQPQFLAKITIIQTVVLVGLDIILIPTYHAFGPAISLAVSNLIVFSASAFKLYSLLRRP
ncbi:MAG: polysaccharide biosynthesis C-terminal domain-containing protein, partial [Patescibacteria group bacterium]